MAGTGSAFPPITYLTKSEPKSGDISLLTARLRWRFIKLTLSAAAIAALCAGCSRNKGLPEPGSTQYRDAVRTFYVGLAGLQTGADDTAKQNLTQATQIAPGEPAAWANLSVLALRQQDFETAFRNADQARTLAPDNSRVEELLGIIESRRGKPSEAIAHLKKAVDADPGNLKALYALAEETEREGSENSSASAGKLFQQVLAKRPNNVAAQLEVARLAAKAGDAAVFQSAVAKLAAASASWPEEAKQQVKALQEAAASGGNVRAAAVRVTFLRNTLVRASQYRQDLNEVKNPADLVGDPFTKFAKLPSPGSEPAAADSGTRFEKTAAPDGSQNATWMSAIPLDDSGKATVVWASDNAVQTAGGAKLAFPGGKGGPIGRSAVLGIDLNYDFRTDLVLAGPGGIRIYEQKDSRTFTDVSARAKLPARVANGSYTGAWAFDADLDGDLDVVLGSTTGATILRNNADGSFAILTPFTGVAGIKAFASADIDNDGDPDVAVIDASGKLYVFANDRLGQFSTRAVSGVSGSFADVLGADANSDGAVDFVLLATDGTIMRLSDKGDGTGWDTARIAKAGSVQHPSLTAADLDNNGRIDFVTGDGEVFLGGVTDFARLASTIDTVAPAMVDLNGDGRLDVIGIAKTGVGAVEFLNRGTKNYRWHDIRVRAANTKGDQRINSFGIGGAIEIRSGLLLQKQVISSPLVHFGIGDSDRADVARIIWPNGAAQAEFELKTGQEILAVQRLKGSCPWLFAWDGKQMSFVKDGAPWSSALGLHINAQTVSGIDQTREWFKIPGESLKPHDGIYDLRVTAELWETYYIDHYSLMVVDHPEGTEIYTDERFALPAPPLKIFTTTVAQPFAAVHDDNGADVSSVVRAEDRTYLDNFGRGPYQGLTRDHWVELELPQSAPAAGPLYLLASGWLHPTDATVNIAVGQNSIPQPSSLSLEVPDGQGHWRAAQKGLGFPAGKMKTVVLDLTGIFTPGAPRKVRMRTNLEIYWDKLAWATCATDRNRIQHLGLAGAELRRRGYSVVRAANSSSPELPDYNRLMSSGQIWHDLEGYTTRHGDVRELLDQTDDRMVIASAGDELRLRFNAPPAPPSKWKRDYIMVGDGWIKDGDLNTVFSKTVLPLPYHGLKQYDKAPGRLEDDPAYKLHPADWQNFHTRYITADTFNKALRN